MSSRSEQGSSALELALVTLPLLLLLGFVVVAGRLGATHVDVVGAAGEAARAASLRARPADAQAAAHTAAALNLADGGVRCRGLEVEVDTSRFRRGGTVAVDVSCTVDLSDVAWGRLPMQRTYSARSVEAIDLHRGGD